MVGSGLHEILNLNTDFVNGWIGVKSDDKFLLVEYSKLILLYE